MKKYSFSLSPQAYKYLARLSVIDRDRIIEKIEQLPEGDTTKMQGFDEPLYRLRVGKYRVTFEKYDDKLIICVIKIWPRGDVYK